jgi:hypothetical protein
MPADNESDDDDTDNDDWELQRLKANAVIRPLPPPPRCRGIEIGPGHYTGGCTFGYGDIPPLSEPCDCPVCNGSGVERGYEPN